MAEKEFENEYYTLTDEDGNELQFELIGSCELDGNEYFALVPVEESEKKDDVVEYVLLKKEKDENGEDILVTIDDDEEFDKIADIFEDELFNEVDLDA